MKLSTTIEEWKEILGDCELHQINVIYECRDFDFWGRQNDPEYESQEKEQPTEFDIDRRGWEMDKSAEYIISALMKVEDHDFNFVPTAWRLYNVILNHVDGNIIEVADGFLDGFHKIKLIVETWSVPVEVVRKIQAVDTRLVVEIQND